MHGCFAFLSKKKNNKKQSTTALEEEEEEEEHVGDDRLFGEVVFQVDAMTKEAEKNKATTFVQGLKGVASVGADLGTKWVTVKGRFDVGDVDKMLYGLFLEMGEKGSVTRISDKPFGSD